MYYHVIVETSEKNKKGNYERCYELDCTDLKDVIELVAKPYSQNRRIYINGRYIEHNQIRQLKIKASDQTLGVLTEIAQRSVARGVLFVYTQITVVNGDNYVKDITKNILKSVGEILKSDNQSSSSKQTEKKSVFIVHGRDSLAKTEAARFVEKLGFMAVILHEQVSAGKTIIEKIEEHANVGFAIVL